MVEASLTLLMPVLNEEEGLESALRRSLAALEKSFRHFEVVVLDDGSTDRTGEIAARMAAEDARIRVVTHPRNLNYGHALRRGIREARCDWLLHQGADLPLAPEDVGGLRDQLDGADVVVVCRTSRAAHSPWRKLTSWTNNLLLRLLFAPRSEDLNFTQFYRVDWARTLDLVSTSPAFITPEIILRAEHTGRRVRRVRATFRRRETGRAHFGRPRDILWTLRDMLRLRVHTWRRGWGD